VEPAEAFGQVLRKRRKEAGLTQEQLAFEADLERVFISWLETGKRQPTFQTMLKLAAALGCKAAELVEEAEALLV
jgi:transcriptional regulator with XRE-family HTH domain